LQVTWRTNPLTSALHAAEAMGRQRPLADPGLAEALEEPARLLAAEIRAGNLPWSRFWGHLLGLSASAAGRRLIVETAVTKTIGRGGRFEMLVTNLAAGVAAVEVALQAAQPNLGEELALRMRPLREQWEARGDGMLRAVGRQTEEALIVEQCEVLAVYPALGGGGGAQLAYNSARIEAVLANPFAELPEVVRLAWLVAQLQTDLPLFSESIHPERLPAIAGFAMLPAVLQGAEEVELVRDSTGLLGQAIAAWSLPAPAGIDAAELVSGWWQTYQETRPPWKVALAALDQLFG
jgi:hypothetical protein